MNTEQLRARGGAYLRGAALENYVNRAAALADPCGRMTRRQYRALGMSWRIMGESQREPDARAHWFAVFRLMGDERRRHGASSVYRVLASMLRQLGTASGARRV